jgi:hypothetical protein
MAHALNCVMSRKRANEEETGKLLVLIWKPHEQTYRDGLLSWIWLEFSPFFLSFFLFLKSKTPVALYSYY